MAKGSIAKDKLAKKMAEVFGQDWIGEYDKKYYVWCEENGEKIQIALSMTCPKTMIEVQNTNSLNFNGGYSSPNLNELNFEDDNFTANNYKVAPEVNSIITEEEKDNIKNLMERLGL